MNANWFNTMREFFNTVRHVRIYFGVDGVIAREIQLQIAIGKSQKECEDIAKASIELCQQVGF